MDNDVILELIGVTKSFPGVKALLDVSISIKKGETHAIIGENGAGKSTLFNIIAGVFPCDEGKIYFDGKEVNIRNPYEARMMGIGSVHQELSLCAHLSIAENIYIGRLPKSSLGFVNYSKLYSDSAEMLKMFGEDIKPSQKVSSLNIAQQQVVEILKALSFDCKLLILDEPTSSLTKKEVTELFRIIKELKAKGTSVLYISHRMSDIFAICDRLTVLRDGQYINTVDVGSVDNDQIIKMMVGRSIDMFYPQKSSFRGRELLRVEGLCSKGHFNDISFALNEGEIVGFCGLVGAGRTEVMRSLCAIDKKDAGRVYLEGKEIEIKSYRDAINKGIVYMTEDRKYDGLFLNLGIKANISASVIDDIRKIIFIDKRNETDICEEYSEKLQIKMSSSEQPCGNLSGGNQQKVLLAKCLATKPKVLIIDEPTRGIDVNVKSEIYKLLRRLCNEGIGVIIITSELQEAIGMCDKVVVIREGFITGVFESDNMSEETIMHHAAHI